jgi:circadian clock protein KaiB
VSARRAKAGKKADRSRADVVLRLYVAGTAPNSAQAVANLEAICREHLDGAHELEIIDVLEHPQHAMAAGILVTPTLCKLDPLPKTQVVGNLSDKPRVLLALGIRSHEA